MNSIGTFTIIKNENAWIGPHLASFLPHVDEMVFFDGNSTDGTLETIDRFVKCHEYGHKIKLFKDKDCRDLGADYVRLFNECLHSLSTDLAWFAHPDMVIAEIGDKGRLTDCIAASVGMESYAGDPGGQLFKIECGRDDKWKSIYRLRNPDLGAHYHGFYGASNEDVYFSAVTGTRHDHYGGDFSRYPYDIVGSGFKLLHFSDVRPIERRRQRMISSLINQGHSFENAAKLADIHPRVTLKDCPPGPLGEFKMVPSEYPEVFRTWEKSLTVAA